MGLLSDMGQVESFENSKKLQPLLKKIGIRQFINVLKKYYKWRKSSDSCSIKWGEQIEGHFLKMNEKGSLQLCKNGIYQHNQNKQFPIMFEYGSWMFEMIPSSPYNTKCNFNEIIETIRKRYQILQQNKQIIPLTIPAIPFIGTNIQQPFNNTITQSKFIDDDHITQHPRFKTLTKNIRLRRGNNVEMYVPLYVDKNTKLDDVNGKKQEYIYLDAMAFGMGLSCLQCTFSTKCLNHARYIYDQLHIISPLFLALTAGTPFHKGKLADWDARWNIIGGSVDDRTQNQRNSQHQDYLPTSRYAQAPLYIWNGPLNRPQYNDFNLNIKENQINQIYQHADLMGVQIDPYLAQHIANIFKRDVLVVHEKFKDLKDDDNTIFQMLNGTNWNSVRLKIPNDDEIGWRVEFRTMQVQLTADQNSAYSLIIHLFTRVFHQECDINMYIPISKVRENFERAHRKDAVRKQKFYFRINIFDNQEPKIRQLSLNQILFGCKQFIGLFNEIQKRMTSCVRVCQKTKILISEIRRFLSDVCSGKKLTLAQWIRRQINNSKLYNHDSLLSKELMDDILLHLYKISKNQIEDPNFYKIFKL